MTKPFDKLFEHSAKTRVQLAAMQLSATGWVAGDLDGQVLGQPMTHLYLWDKPTGWGFMCAVPYQTFQEVSLKASHFQSADIAAVRYGVSAAINALAAGETLPEVNGLTTTAQLAISATAYMGTTKVWQIADRMRNQASALILNYRDRPDSSEGLLRPVVAPTSAMMPVPAFLAAVQQIVHQDQIAHPGWFTPTRHASR